MQFFKSLLLCLTILLPVAHAAGLKDIVVTKELGSCETNDLAFSAMRFYKIPLNQKYENYDLYLRIILFFNQDNSLSMRSTVQALLGCQTTPSGQELCSFGQINDQWIQSSYQLDEKISVPRIGSIHFKDETNVNRGFTLTFSDDFTYPHLRGHEFIGGMITTNFNQHGKNSISICNN